MMQQAQKEQKKGTDAMLSALSLVNNKVQEFDSTNNKTLEQLEQKEQLRFVEWFQRWSGVMDAQLAFHSECVKKLKELEQVWQEAVGAKPAATAEKDDASIRVTEGVQVDDDEEEKKDEKKPAEAGADKKSEPEGDDDDGEEAKKEDDEGEKKKKKRVAKKKAAAEEE